MVINPAPGYAAIIINALTKQTIAPIKQAAPPHKIPTPRPNTAPKKPNPKPRIPPPTGKARKTAPIMININKILFRSEFPLKLFL